MLKKVTSRDTLLIYIRSALETCLEPTGRQRLSPFAESASKRARWTMIGKGSRAARNQPSQGKFRPAADPCLGAGSVGPEWLCQVTLRQLAEWVYLCHFR